MPVFVDTNILIYAEDRDAKGKHLVARDLVVKLWEEGDGVLSVQVLQEFYVNVTRKLKRPISATRAKETVEEYLHWRVIETSRQLLVDALEFHRSASLSFWDALVVQAAIEAGCERLYTEVLDHGQRFGSLLVVNPFIER